MIMAMHYPFTTLFFLKKITNVTLCILKYDPTNQSEYDPTNQSVITKKIQNKLTITNIIKNTKKKNLDFRYFGTISTITLADRELGIPDEYCCY